MISLDSKIYITGKNTITNKFYSNIFKDPYR